MSKWKKGHSDVLDLDFKVNDEGFAVFEDGVTYDKWELKDLMKIKDNHELLKATHLIKKRFDAEVTNVC